MEISAEAQAIIDQLKADNSILTERVTSLVDAQADAAMATREAQVVGLCERLKLPNEEVEINFSEAGEAAKKVKTTWKPFLVSLSEEQFQAFSGLADGLVKAAGDSDSGGLMFSEFDRPANGGNVELNAADSTKLGEALKAKRHLAIAAYSSGKAMA